MAYTCRPGFSRSFAASFSSKFSRDLHEKERTTKMKSFATLRGAAAIALLLLACNQAPTPAPDTHDADVKAISDLEAQWNKDYAAKDGDKVAGYYATDAIQI